MKRLFFTFLMFALVSPGYTFLFSKMDVAEEASIVENYEIFTTVYDVVDNGSAFPNGIGLYDLLSTNDRVFPFDYNGDGNEDLFLYRPGSGAVNVIRSNGDGTFTTVYDVVDNGSAFPNGIGLYDLLSTNDRVFPFDYNGDGNEDLFLYRPGSGAVNVIRSNGDGTFTTVYDVVDNGSALPNGIGLYDLLSTNDRVFPFDYNGDGNEDLFLYRPGSGAVNVVRSNGDGTFITVYDVVDNGSAFPNGIGLYDLLSTNDRVFPFDYNGDGNEDLFLYRPGSGAVNVIHSNGDGTFTTVYDVVDNGSALPNGIGLYDLLSTNDRVLPFDYNGDGNEDLFLYRPGSGAVNVIRSNGDGTFLTVYDVGDNGSDIPNGIGLYDLLSTKDIVFPFDYNGDGNEDLFLYRPGSGAVNVVRSNGDEISITIISPNGGDIFEAGSNKNISWDSTGLNGNVKIEYSIDNGANWLEIVLSTPNDGLHPWTIPDTTSNQCLVKISETDGTPSDTSDSVFSIVPPPIITLISPNGGEQWEVSSVQNITWSSTGVIENVKIEYSYFDGSSQTDWISITPSMTNDGSYLWTVPDTVATGCIIKVSDLDGTPEDMNDMAFSIVPFPAITVTFPNGGETWEVDTQQNITWTSVGAVENFVKIEFSTDNGTSWQSIIPSTPNNGSYTWTVPKVVSNLCFIRISESDGEPMDTNDAAFVISSPDPFINITFPNGGETLPCLSLQNITWTSSGIDNVIIEYSQNSGGAWKTIVTSIPNNGSYMWTVPDKSSDRCLIRITSSDITQGLSDVSDAEFFIVEPVPPAIMVTSPNGGENWESRSINNITWTSQGDVGNVRIEYSTDKGTSWITIVESTENDGIYDWTVPDIVSDSCFIRISETDGDPSDESDKRFSIVVPTSITIISPNGGENWEVDSKQNVTWVSTGDIGKVKIELSTDNGTNWIIIEEKATNNGSYKFTVPNSPSENCLVRISENNSSGNKSDVSDAVFSITSAFTAITQLK